MKKIFAFVLAMLMVLSIVPASAFAAFGEACPTTHTRLNCVNEYVTTVDATCTTHGYDIYACAKCGAEIYDNFVDPVAHKYVSGADAKHTNKAATCSEGGWEWVVKCQDCSTGTVGLTACDKSCGNTNCKLYKKIVEVKHNFVANGKGMGCEAQYECSLCGEIRYKSGDAYIPTAEHEFDYKKAEVTDAPYWKDGNFTSGWATVTCTVKGCNYEKSVEITSMACQHYAATIVQEYVEETCFVDGSKQILECRDCKVYYVDADKDGDIDAEESKLVDNKGNATKDLKFAVINEITDHVVPATGFISTENCICVYVCERCNTTQSKEIHQGLDPDDKGIEYPPTCLNPGYDFAYCSVCKKNVTEVKPATNHKDTTFTITVTPSCVNKGATYTVCFAADCTYVKSTVIDANNSALATVMEKLGSSAIVSDAKATTYSLRVIKTEKEKAIDTSEHTLEYWDVSKNPAVKYDEMPEQDCTGYKIIQIVCAYGCDANDVKFIEPGDHDWYVSKKFVNCNMSANDSAGKLLPKFTERVYSTCADCGETKCEDNYIGFKTNYASEEELEYYHGEIYYEAGSDKKLVKKTRMGNTVNPMTDLTGQQIYLKAPTCTDTGLANYTCSLCQTTYYVTVAKVAHTPKKGTLATDASYTGGKAPASCGDTGIWDSFKCAHCNNSIIKHPITGKQEIVTNLAIKAHGANLQKLTSDICAGVVYYQCSCGNNFSDWTATTPFDPATVVHKWSYVQHKTVATCNTTGKYEVRFCTEKACAKIEVNAYFEIEGVVVPVNMYTGTRAFKANGSYNDTSINDKIAAKASNGTWSTKDFKIKANGTGSGDYTIDIPMLNHKSPLNGAPAAIVAKIPADLKKGNNFDTDTRPAATDHTTPGYTANECRYCEHEFFSNYTAASGDHVNVSGQIITTDCTNSIVKDRFCIYCNDNVLADHKYGKVISVDATCSTNGYDCQVCELCNYRNILSTEPKTESYHTSYDFVSGTDGNKIQIGQQSNYAQVGTKYSVVCALCNKNIDEAKNPEEIKEAGLEILINADSTTIIPGSTVKVTVSLASLKGVDVWALAFPVVFDAEVFDFVGYEWNTADSAFQTFTVTEVAGGIDTYDFQLQIGPDDLYDYEYYFVTDGVMKDSGVLHIVANADDNVVIKGEEALVTLEFKVISANVTESQTFSVTNSKLVATGGSFGKKLGELCKDIINPKTGVEYGKDSEWMKRYGNVFYEVTGRPSYKYINTEVLNANGEEVKVNYNGVNYTDVIEVADFLNLDDNFGITLSDAYALYSLIYNNEYDVKADANHDGKVDGRDLSILYAVYTGVITVEQLIAPDAVLPEGFEAWMGAK